MEKIPNQESESQNESIKDIAARFKEVYAEFSSMADERNRVSEPYIAPDGLGMAGMEVAGIWEDYKKLEDKISEKIETLRAMVTPENKEDLIKSLKDLGEKEAAKYISKTM